MKYNCLRIYQENDGWKVSDAKDTEDRVDVKTIPNPHGFYYYPENMPLAEATNALITCMAKKHIIEIERLQLSLNKLLELREII